MLGTDDILWHVHGQDKLGHFLQTRRGCQHFFYGKKETRTIDKEV